MAASCHSSTRPCLSTSLFSGNIVGVSLTKPTSFPISECSVDSDLAHYVNGNDKAVCTPRALLRSPLPQLAVRLTPYTS